MNVPIPKKIEVKASPIHGLGVFAIERIEPNEIIEICYAIFFKTNLGEHNDIFLKYMKKIQLEINLQGKEVVFVVFSNEKVKFTIESTNIIYSENKWYVDHYLMSQCNYLIGPPSTFSLWASYVGKTPYYHIKDVIEDISLNNFKCCTG